MKTLRGKNDLPVPDRAHRERNVLMTVLPIQIALRVGLKAGCPRVRSARGNAAKAAGLVAVGVVNLAS